MSFVYFIATDHPQIKLVKIGFARSVEERLSSLNTASPLDLKIEAMAEGSPEDERWLHRRYNSARVKNEWFSRTPGIEHLISTVRATGKLPDDIRIANRPKARKYSPVYFEREHPRDADLLAAYDRALSRGGVLPPFPVLAAIRTMKADSTIFIPGSSGSVRSITCRFGKQINAKFVTEREDGGVRIWRVA